MLTPGFVHTKGDQTGDPETSGAVPHFGPNDNFTLGEMSLFYGGAIWSDIGLGGFIQTTYSDTERHFGWDNVDIRLARKMQAFGQDLTLGLTLNNNPTVQDPWNTVPAWRFPFMDPGALMPATTATSTLIEGGLGQQVLGLGGYAWWNNLLYAEVAGYTNLSRNTLKTLGGDPNASNLDGIAPYWRVAVEPKFGLHSIEVGTFGLIGKLFPDRVKDFGSDKFTDIGFDTQYQFNGERDNISLQLSWIHESQDLRATSAIAGTNAHNTVRSFNAKASYFWDHTYGANVGYFNSTGTSDATLFGIADQTTGELVNGGSPNSNGWVFEVNYLPFSHGGPSFWPWLNAKVGLQYTLVNKLQGTTSNIDGAGRKPSDNNTLFLYAWIAF
jgi:hypothetical protein